MNLHLMKASGRLARFEEQLILAFDDVAQKIEGRLSLPNVDVLMADYADMVIPETGVVGFTITPNLIYIYFDPESSHFQAYAKEEIAITLTHELHHAARQNTVGYGATLLEGMVFEGLADHFDIEINNFEPFAWSTALTDAQLEEQLQRAAPEFNSTEYDHQAWFFGSEERNIPRWTGYSLGFEIVGKYLKNTGKTAAELFDAPAKLFVE